MPKKWFILTLSFLFVLSIAIMAELGEDQPVGDPGLEHWNPIDGHKMHEPQLPDEAGWDVNATFPVVLADDWECSETGWIQDIHFWGSWRHGEEGVIESFTLSIHEDIPADQNPAGYSMPGTVIQEWDVYPADMDIVQITSPLWEGWYNPNDGTVEPNDHNVYYQYNYDLPQDVWVWQDEGTIYWLNITAHLDPQYAGEWGWKSSLLQFFDDAVWKNDDAGIDWQDMYRPNPPLSNMFEVTINDVGKVIEGWGEYAYGNGWYYYPQPPDIDPPWWWWNIWFYDHPFSYERQKISDIFLEITPFQVLETEVTIAVNWSTDLWSLEGNPLPQQRRPPLPPLTDAEERAYIGRDILWQGVITGLTPITVPWEKTEYNPEWISIDVSGYNFILYNGEVQHDCIPKVGTPPEISMDLAFVITGAPENAEACCFGDGTCRMLDAGTCTSLGGTPQGPGTTCTQMEACCLIDGSCIMADPLCCTSLGGTPQGPGTQCSGTMACCFTDGSCQDLDPLCCIQMGGTLGLTGGPCLGDADGDGTDDACQSPPVGACCFPDGSCQEMTQAACVVSLGNRYMGDYSRCAGDNNGNGADDLCEGWNPGDPHKMHEPQLPDEVGWNVNATYPMILADDWTCSEDGWVKDFHFWGSWKHNDIGHVNSFLLSIHSDIPADQSASGHSEPADPPLWTYEATEYGMTMIKPEPHLYEGWYNPFNPTTGEEEVYPNDHHVYFQYDVILPQDFWFWQEMDTIYWLNISADVEDPSVTEWGWKSSYIHHMDDAVWKYDDPIQPTSWIEMYQPSPPLTNLFNVTVDEIGEVLSGWGDYMYGNGWYFYPQPDPDEPWWNIWFYDHPFDDNRWKYVRIEFDVVTPDPTYLGWLTVAVNWSTDLWSLEGNPLPERRMPPLPPLDPIAEADYIGRMAKTSTDVTPIVQHVIYEFEILDYNPEWVSVDVQGYNFEILEGRIIHECLPKFGTEPQSLDLAFVVTGDPGGGETEACCFPDGTCADLDPATCIAQSGTPQGPSTACSGRTEACCLNDGTCRDVDPVCCDDLGGVPQGPGTSCSGQTEACCFDDGTCQDLDPICCDDMGGTPGGPGSSCAGTTVACCWFGGGCMTTDANCCVDLGGTPSPIGATTCLGDGNSDGIDDACQILGACCLDDGSCQDGLTRADCDGLSGDYMGDRSTCLGDANSNGSDDLCEGWNPGDPHKMHEPQYPDEAGWDVNATYPIVLADDWTCSETGWVQDIHFWGSWLNGEEGIIESFTLSIHSDIPASQSPTDYSMPGELLWEFTTDDYIAIPIISDLWEGWYDPPIPDSMLFNHQEYFQYNVYLPESRWFKQDEGTIYWLNITAHLVSTSPPATWGWKSSYIHHVDDAVWAEEIGGGLCVAPDNGTGTVELPARCADIDCDCDISTTPVEPMEMIDGFPPGSGIHVDAKIQYVSCTHDGQECTVQLPPDVCEGMGGSLGGNVHCYEAYMELHMTGHGEYDWYERIVVLPVHVEGHTGPRNPGDPVQEFPADMYRLHGILVGDPDFETLRVTAGTDYGLPSPGQATLTDLGGGLYNIDSFFDITYQIEFQGSMGGPFEDLAGTTTATARFTQGGDAEMPWVEMYEPREMIRNEFMILIDENEEVLESDGNHAYRDGWYYYPQPVGTEPAWWWNIWFYDHPFDYSRMKMFNIELDIHPLVVGLPSYVVIAINYSTPLWSLEANPIPERRVPPLPGVTPENDYIGRIIVYDGEVPTSGAHWSFDGQITDFNPEWISVDVSGYNFGIPFGWIDHICLPRLTQEPQSLDLSFVITGEPDDDTCAEQYPGDVDNDGDIDQDDYDYLKAFLYLGGPTPPIMANADPNGDCWVDNEDLEYLYAYLNYVPPGPAPVECTCVNPTVCNCLVGDANGDGSINIGDEVYIENIVFRAGSPAPTPYATCSGDANFDCTINIGDAVFIGNIVFRPGSPMPPDCHDWATDPIKGCGWPLFKK